MNKAAQEIRDAAADAALEKEVFEKGHGFLERPYDRYRFHNGFTEGFDAGHALAIKQAEVLVERVDAILRNPVYSSHMALGLWEDISKSWAEVTK